jgi:hypothetical protein
LDRAVADFLFAKLAAAAELGESPSPPLRNRSRRQAPDLRLETVSDPPGSAEANLKAMDGAVVLERDRERPHGDRRAIELGGGDAALHALRILDNDLIPRGAVSEHYLETGP